MSAPSIPAEEIPPPPDPNSSQGTMALVETGSGASAAVTKQVETASTAVAAQARAAVEARYLVAMKNPRSIDTTRVRILAACKRPKFAETARYRKPVGGKDIIGPSIRFAEESLRALGNSYVESMVVFDDADRRIVRVTVTDLETNLSYPQDLLIAKTVERRNVRQGQTVLGKRANSTGQIVYIVEATEDDLFVKQSALTSKAIRTAALRLLPSDILEEAMEQVVKTLESEESKDPAGARKRLVDAFYELGIAPTDLVDYLGHRLDQTTPAELSMLRTFYTALKEGEAVWSDVLETKGKSPKEAVADRGGKALEQRLAESGAQSQEGSAPRAQAGEPPSPTAATPASADPRQDAQEKAARAIDSPDTPKSKRGELPFGNKK